MLHSLEIIKKNGLKITLKSEYYPNLFDKPELDVFALVTFPHNPKPKLFTLYTSPIDLDYLDKQFIDETKRGLAAVVSKKEINLVKLEHLSLLQEPVTA